MSSTELLALIGITSDPSTYSSNPFTPTITLVGPNSLGPKRDGAHLPETSLHLTLRVAKRGIKIASGQPDFQIAGVHIKKCSTPPFSSNILPLNQVGAGLVTPALLLDNIMVSCKHAHRISTHCAGCIGSSVRDYRCECGVCGIDSSESLISRNIADVIGYC